ncbi:MAG: UrcA family protein [Sphingomonadales bacterium]|jgi:UrcA family protein|nr:UrcA family protein [Sphingomonadales bacterium]
MKTLAKTFTLALAAAGLAGTAITPAFAEDAPRRTTQISVADLDLGTAAGQRTLDKRIEKAVREVCRTVSVKTGTRIMDQDAQNCLARARADAKQQMATLVRNEQRGG